MRIASYHNLPSGGAKRSLYEETKGLAVNHEIDVFTLSTADKEYASLKPLVANHTAIDFHPLGLLKSPFGRLNQAIRMVNLRRIDALNREIASIIDAGGYDVLYVNPCLLENCPSVLRYVHRVPSVFFCHEPLRILYETMPVRPYDRPEAAHRQLLNRIDPLPGLYRRQLQMNDQRNMKSADMVLVNSHFTKEAVQRIYQLDARVNYKGVNAELFRPLDVEKDQMILSVGSLTPLKGLDFIIKALARIPKDERLKLVIASNFQNPPEREYLQNLAAENEVELELMSNISDQLLVELYNRALITVYTPIREPLGLVPLESLACGTPVVTVAEGGMKETVIHGETGLLTERDVNQFSSAIRKLISNPSMAAAFGRAGREDIEKRWSWERSVAGLEESFRSLVK
jgi:glycosyltransferase involved in cell wall biosynthesis